MVEINRLAQGRYLEHMLAQSVPSGVWAVGVIPLSPGNQETSNVFLVFPLQTDMGQVDGQVDSATVSGITYVHFHFGFGSKRPPPWVHHEPNRALGLAWDQVTLMDGTQERKCKRNCPRPRRPRPESAHRSPVCSPTLHPQEGCQLSRTLGMQSTKRRRKLYYFHDWVYPRI